jgi:hypothetical protein
VGQHVRAGEYTEEGSHPATHDITRFIDRPSGMQGWEQKFIQRF